MKKSNALYKNQGIHVITAIFTVEQGVTKVLLVKRKNEPYKGDWTLTGGALYNNEDLEAGAKREILEKSGIENIEIDQFHTFGKVDRSSVMRMIAVAYVGVIDCNIVSTDILKALFPNEFTLPEIQKTYEAILNRKFDRRNFRKKLLNLNLIEDTKRTGKFEGKKPAKL